MRKQILIFILIFSCNSFLLAQDNIKFLKTNHDFDTVYEGKTYKAKFYFQNIGDQNYNIINVVSSTTSLSIRYSPKLLQPNDTSSLTCFLFSQDFLGNGIEETIDVFVGTGEIILDTIVLTVTADVIKSKPELYFKSLNDTSITTTFIQGKEIDTLIFDFGEVENYEYKHAVIFIKTINNQPLSQIPNAKEFINFDYSAILTYFPTKTNPIINKEELPFHYSGRYSRVLKTTVAKPVKWVDSAYFNVVLFQFRGFKNKNDSICHIIKENLGSKQIILVFKAVYTQGSRSIRDIIWKDDYCVRAHYYEDDYDLLIGLTPRIHIDDFNKDGFQDSMIVNIVSRYYPEKYISWMQFYDGATKKSFPFYRPSLYEAEKEGRFLTFLNFDSDICTAENMPIVRMIRDSMFSVKDQKIGPSLEWFLKDMKTKSIKVDSPFYSMRTIEPKWYPWPAIFPESYYVWYEFDSTMNDYYIEPGKGWLFYIGGWHKVRDRKTYSVIPGFQYVDSNKTYKIYRTSHGLIAKKGGKYCWVYHNPGGEKLRWDIISKEGVWLYKNYVIIALPSFEAAPGYFLLINIETGVIKGFDVYSFIENNECCYRYSCKIQNGFLVFKGIAFECDNMTKDEKNKTIKVKLTNLIKEFEK